MKMFCKESSYSLNRDIAICFFKSKVKYVIMVIVAFSYKELRSFLYLFSFLFVSLETVSNSEEKIESLFTF